MPLSNIDDYISYCDVDTCVDVLTWERKDLVTAIEEAQEALNAAKDALAEHNPEDYDEDNYGGDDTTKAERELAKLQDAVDDAESDLTKAKDDLEEWDTDNAYDLRMWTEVRDEMSNYGADTLINEDVWSEYARTLVEDMGDVDLDSIPGYIRNNINWDGVADDLQSDYSCIDIDGTTFYYR